MRIWIVNQYAYSPSHSAGTRNYFLARELVRRGHEALIISTGFFHHARKETRLEPGELWKKEIVDGVRFHWLRTPPYRTSGILRLWNMLVFGSRVKREIGLGNEKKPDVIIGSSPHPFAALAAEKLARKHKVPFVLELRDLWPDNLIDMGSLSTRHPVAIIMSKILQYLYRRADLILTALPISPIALNKALDFLEHKGADRSSIHWLPNGVALDEFPYHRVDTTGSARPSVLKLLYIGSHNPYSDLDNLLAAAKLLQDDKWENRVSIRLIGDGSEKPRLRKKADKMGLTILSFDPPVPQTEIYSLLSKADGFIMTYADSKICHWGSSPSKLFHYMAAGKPVIYALGKKYSPVEKAGAGISVRAGDPRALAEGIKELYRIPPDERAIMGGNGRKYVEELHDIRKLGVIFEDVLKELLCSAPQSQLNRKR